MGQASGQKDPSENQQDLLNKLIKFRHNLETITVVQDISEILIDSSTDIATTPKFTETLITIKDILEISTDSNMKTATIPESEGISKISLKHYRL